MRESFPMQMRTLIDVAALTAALGADDLVIVDCRFDLTDPGAGRRAYRESHLPGAVYVDLDRDLSDRSRHGHGRHPLPDVARFCETLSRLGIAPEHRVVAYDAGNGAFAARLWWMLRAVGHRQVAVLDGGYAQWLRNGAPTTAEVAVRVPTRYRSERTEFDTVSSAGIWAEPDLTLIDARAAERFRGEVEPIDPVAGHIPGALNRPFTENLDRDGRFKSPARLAEEFAALLGDRAGKELAVMCGSGVTACHHLLAMAHAGIEGARLYADSWSGWIADPARPIARG